MRRIYLLRSGGIRLLHPVDRCIVWVSFHNFFISLLREYDDHLLSLVRQGSDQYIALSIFPVMGSRSSLHVFVFVEMIVCEHENVVRGLTNICKEFVWKL